MSAIDKAFFSYALDHTHVHGEGPIQSVPEATKVNEVKILSKIGIFQPTRGIEPQTFSLRMKCSATELYGQLYSCDLVALITILTIQLSRSNSTIKSASLCMTLTYAHGETLDEANGDHDIHRLFVSIAFHCHHQMRLPHTAPHCHAYNMYYSFAKPQ